MEEGIQKTANEMIYIGNALEIDEDQFWEQLAMLEEACERNAENIKELVAEVLPTYHLQGQKGTAAVS